VKKVCVCVCVEWASLHEDAFHHSIPLISTGLLFAVLSSVF